MEQTLTVVVADLDALVTECIADLLERHGHNTRISPPKHEAVRDWVRKYHADLCVIGRLLRDGDGLEEIGHLLQESPWTKVIVRTADTSAEALTIALSAGVAGYIDKSCGPVILLDAIERVLSGKVVVEGTFIPSTIREPDGQADFRRRIDGLTPRQRECLDMIVEGMGTVAMASRLGVSTMTVRTHVQAVLEKLDVRSRIEAVSLVAKHQLLDPS